MKRLVPALPVMPSSRASGCGDNTTPIGRRPKKAGGRPRVRSAPSYVEVINGMYDARVPFRAGETVATLRQRLKQRLNILDEAIAILDGQPVSDQTRPTNGQTLNFIKRAAEVGGRNPTECNERIG